MKMIQTKGKIWIKLGADPKAAHLFISSRVKGEIEVKEKADGVYHGLTPEQFADFYENINSGECKDIDLIRR